MEILSKSPTETKKLAFRIAKKISAGNVLALYGDLGAGKTTFVQGLVFALGFLDKVQSPTFVLMRQYKKAEKFNKISSINHIDLYRITNVEEALNLGIEEIMEDPNSVSIIEWPEIIEEYLPKDSVKLKFQVVSEFQRRVLVQKYK